MTLRVGLVGAGAVAGYHAAAIAGHGDSDLVAVCDLDAGRAEGVASGVHGRPAVFTDHLSMLDAAGLDAVVVNTPHALHEPMAVELLERGIAVLVEKPLATTPDRCGAVIDVARRTGTPLGVGQIQHYLPEKVAVADALAAGEIGPVVAVDDRRPTDYRPGSRPSWFFDRAMSGGGAMINVGGHSIDRALWFGGARAHRVRASLAHRWGSPVETDAHFDLELINGVAVAITVRSDLPVRRDEVVVVGEHGTLVAVAKQGAWRQVDGRTTRLHRSRPGDIAAAFVAQWQDFIDVVAGRPGRVDVDHAHHIVEVVAAGYRAAATEGWVSLPPVPGTPVPAR